MKILKKVSIFYIFLFVHFRNLGFNNLDESSFDEMAFEDMNVYGTLDMSFNRLPHPPKSLMNVPIINL